MVIFYKGVALTCSKGNKKRKKEAKCASILKKIEPMNV